MHKNNSMRFLEEYLSENLVFSVKFPACVAPVLVVPKLLALCLLLMCSIWHSQLFAQGFDITAPTLLHEKLIEPAAAGQDVELSALVSDDTGVELVKIHFRMAGQDDYKSLAMQQLENTDNYKVRIPFAALTQPGEEQNTLWVDYYIEATDFAGNTVMRGFAFAPLQLAISNTAVPLFADSISKKSKVKSKRKWLWVGLGVLAVGAIASAGGGGSDGGGGDISGTSLSKPITISAPIPD